MNLTERHKTILKALIDEFILCNKPVGSSTICEKYEISLSSATIRSVLKELEDYGYIASRHTSGGRVPTETGYRFYVDSLMVAYELTYQEKRRIQEEYLKMQFKMDQILKATANVLASLSQSAGVIFGPVKDLDTLKHIELIHVSGQEILMIIVTRSGSVINRNIFLNRNFSQEELYQISKYLNDHLKGYDFFEIQEKIVPNLRKQRNLPSFFSAITDDVLGTINFDHSEVNIYIDGIKNLCSNFSDERLENVLGLLEEKNFLKKIFSSSVNNEGVFTFIGEVEDKYLNGVSIIVSNYKMGDKKIGSIGVLGPQRMNYNRNLPLVEFTSKLVSEMITKLSK